LFLNYYLPAKITLRIPLSCVLRANAVTVVDLQNDFPDTPLYIQYLGGPTENERKPTAQMELQIFLDYSSRVQNFAS
jgi:hypothetical protein